MAGFSCRRVVILKSSIEQQFTTDTMSEICLLDLVH